MSSMTIYWAQFLASILSCLSTVSDGIHSSWTSPNLPKLLSPESPIKITNGDVDMLELIFLIGGIAGLPFTMWSVDKFGRKYTITIAAASNCITWLLIFFADRVFILYIARFLAGFNSDVAFVSVPMYISEIADKKIRGFLVTLIYIMLLVGIVVCYSIAPFITVASSSLVGLSIVTLQLIVFPLMPETPYYHLLQNKPEAASKSLQFFRRAREDEVEKELEELKLAVSRQSQERGKFKDVFAVNSNRRGLIIMTALNAAQHLGSNTVMVMKLHTILGNTEGFLTANSAAITFSLIMLFAAIIASTIVDKFGRKVLLIFSSLATSLALFVLAGYMTAVNICVDISGVKWIPIVSVFTFAAVYRLGLGSVPIVVTGELFPTSVKAMAMTMSDAMYVIVGTLVLYLFQLLDQSFGMHVPFFLFSASCIGTAVFVHIYIPETKGKTLEQIQLMLKGLKENDSDIENMTPLQPIENGIVNKVKNETHGLSQHRL